MSYELFLPEDKEQLADALTKIIDEGEQLRHIEEVNWWLAYHYLKGARDFSNVNYLSGTVDVSYVNHEGHLAFRYDDIVSKYQAQMGRFLQMDLAPSVARKGVGLDGLAKASIAQICLDQIMPMQKVNQLKLQLFPLLSRYGTVGLCAWADGATGEMGIDVAPPWELVPIPGNITERIDARGVGRVRYVPIDWVQTLDGMPSKQAKIWGEMEKASVPRGMAPSSGTTGKFATYSSTITTASKIGSGLGMDKKKDDSNVDLVKFSEIWITNTTGYLRQYIIMAGGKILRQVDYEGKKVVPPMQVAYDFDTGGFWGRSFVSILLPINIENENTISRIFQNLQETDAYGMLLVPTTLGVPANIMRGQDGLKRIPYSPDYTAPDLKPSVLTPFNSGTMPAKVIEVGMSLANNLANQPTNLMQGNAPGRVDSQKGLGFLYEVSNMPLSPTSLSLGEAVSNCYRSLLDLSRIIWETDKVLQISMLDDSLAGVVIDAKTGTVKLADNIVPHPDDIVISIKSALPKSAEQEKAELYQALQSQAIDIMEFRFEVRKRGLSIPVGNEEEWQNYRRAMMENLVLFGDGKQPGQVFAHEMDNHIVHTRVLKTFMARPEFHAAATEVKDKFFEHIKYHIQMSSNPLPDQAPYPEEAAEEQALQAQYGGMGMPGMDSMEGMENEMPEEMNEEMSIEDM